VLAVVAVLVALTVGGALARRDVSLVPLANATGSGDRTPAPLGSIIPDALARLGRTPFATRLGDRRRLARRAGLAGLRGRDDAVAGIRAVGALAAATTSLFAGIAVTPAALAIMPVVIAVAIQGPDIALVRLAKRRQLRIAAKVPELVELLVTTTRAGLSPAVAFRRSVNVLRGPLAEEVTLAVQEIDLGVPWAVAQIGRAHV